jgi:ABC-type multidrug transport system ATPase subunit/ABC-type multidrug transport system permease subunit
MSKSTCPNCDQSNPADEIICQHCGLTLPALQDQDAETTRPEARRSELATTQRHRAVSADTLGMASSEAAVDVETASIEEAGLDKAGFDKASPTQPVSTPKPRENTTEQAPTIPDSASVLRIGYADDNDLVIPRPQVSGRHARIARFDGRYVLEDLNSTNGTSLNGQQIARAEIEPGDRVGLGSYQFVFDAEIARRLEPAAKQELQELQATQALQAVSPAGAPSNSQQARSIVIGREADADIVLDAPQISRHHCKLTPTQSGWRVEDLGAANGTFVNERFNRVDEAFVTDDDVLFLGSYRFPVSRVREFIDTDHESVSAGQVGLPLDKEIVTIGRGPENDVVLDGPQVSRNHARIVRTDDAVFLEDIGSANGTFIDGEKVDRVALEPGQTISFGSYAIRLDLARGTVQKSYRGDILLQAENIRVEVGEGDQKFRILDGVSFTVYPTEFVGLLGPSGAGKTTLLMALIGYLRPNYGRTLVNGDDLATHYDRYRGAIGYVPQEDIIHSELTVFEALYYTAKLRLPPDTTDEEIYSRIDKILADLEIEDTRHVLIGSPERKGISGGQRKRVNLALELLTEPSLLCLDEPTSGLASEDASNVMKLLRKLADGGRTILLTIHQPSPQVYRMMDNALYLADGEQVYYGPAYPDSMFYFNSDVKPNTPKAEEILADPGSCMRPLMDAKRAGEPMETFAARYRQSRYHEEFVKERRKNRKGVRLTGSSERKPPRFSIRQWLTLSRRYLAIKLKDRVGTAILLVQAPIVAILLNLVFVSETGGVMSRLQFMPFALFLLVVAAVWFGCSNAAREIVAEQAIYRRERMVNLSILAYAGSKFAVLGALCFLQCLMLLVITYFVLDFWGNPFIHLGVLWLCSLAGLGMGLMLSALVRTTEAAIALVPILLIPQVILGGAIMPIDKMNAPTQVASHSTVARWGFEGMLQTEHRADAYEISADELPKSPMPGIPAPPPPPNPLDRFMGESETYLGVDLGVLGGFTVVFFGGVCGFLRVREKWWGM